MDFDRIDRLKLSYSDPAPTPGVILERRTGGGMVSTAGKLHKQTSWTGVQFPAPPRLL